jgi:hypothetical protein
MERTIVAITTFLAFVLVAFIVIAIGGAFFWMVAIKVVGGAR